MTNDIIILGPAFPYRGGIADTNHSFAKELQSKGYTVQLWTFTQLYPSILFPGTTQFSTERQQDTVNIKRKIHAYNPLNWSRIAKEINSQAPKVVVFRYWTPLLALCWNTIAKKLIPKIKKVALVDNWQPHEPKPWDKLLNHRFAKSMDLITTLSEAVHSKIIRETNIPVSKGFHPINNNLPNSISQKEALYKVEKKSPLLLFFGLVRAYKGLDILIKAMATEPLLHSETQLIILGEFYDNPKPYEKLIKKLRLENRIQIINKFVSFEEIRDYFCAADIVVQPYKSATQSGVIPLAYYYETPMVVTDIEGLKKPVLEDRTGKISALNPEDLAKQITSLMEPNALQSAKNNLHKLKDKYSWSSFVEAWLNFISHPD